MFFDSLLRPWDPEWGGGGNSLNSPKSGENIESSDAENDEKYVVVSKTYEDYFVDYFNLPSELYTIDNSVVTINYSNITKTTSNGEISLSYNGSVFDVITSQDLAGTGSITTPYIVHSTKGFLYLTNNSLSGISLSSKYIELEDDIVLNDETFDKDGNPSGGDGIVYQWKPLASYSNIYLIGNSHKITGIYANNHSVFYGLFGDSSLRNVQDLKIRNFYITSTSTAVSLAYTIINANNCSVGEGTISGEQYVAGFCFGNTSTSMIYCENYANITAKNNFASGFAYRGANFENCSNYGNVKAGGNAGGFISYRWEVNATFVDCANYGDISASNLASGFVPEHLSGMCVFENCSNFGDMYITITNSAKYASGFVASGPNNYFYNCTNKGQIVAGLKCGSFLGQGTCQIVNCKDYQNLSKGEFTPNLSLIGIATSMSYISNCYIEVENYQFYDLGNYGSGALFAREGQVTVKNVDVVLISKNEKNNVYLADASSKNSEFGNICIKTNFEVSSPTILRRNADCKKEGIIISTNSESRYYGSDFSGFYFNFKTGKIGLKALSGKGFYQGKVTEEYLINNGYVKKDA